MFNAWLAVGGVMSLGAALLHLAIIIGGPNWYRYFGAGEEVGRMAAEGRWRPAIITGLVAIGLALCGLYALSGAGLVPSLPLLDIVLCVVAGAYTLRGLAYPVLKVMNSEASTPFFLWSSIICLIVGVVHLIGLAQIRG
ncbi:MAG: hypothetical protein CMM55_02095 [Rhodospirillaceae bacterium]|nr:hypothetical protein [Rhodospirillaceae bacterium]|tara:strand:+ start:2431 stop:2847 length:417 start_codon:yes stop_codon:yes gene_type:complete